MSFNSSQAWKGYSAYGHKFKPRTDPFKLPHHDSPCKSLMRGWRHTLSKAALLFHRGEKHVSEPRFGILESAGHHVVCLHLNAGNYMSKDRGSRAMAHIRTHCLWHITAVNLPHWLLGAQLTAIHVQWRKVVPQLSQFVTADNNIWGWLRELVIGGRSALIGGSARLMGSSLRRTRVLGGTCFSRNGPPEIAQRGNIKCHFLPQLPWRLAAMSDECV